MHISRGLVIELVASSSAHSHTDRLCLVWPCNMYMYMYLYTVHFTCCLFNLFMHLYTCITCVYNYFIFAGLAPILVATDVASRGLDIKDITLVCISCVQFD